jgi:multidrug efflux pump
MTFTADYARQVEAYFEDSEVETYLVITGFPDVTRAIAMAR